MFPFPRTSPQPSETPRETAQNSQVCNEQNELVADQDGAHWCRQKTKKIPGAHIRTADDSVKGLETQPRRQRFLEEHPIPVPEIQVLSA